MYTRGTHFYADWRDASGVRHRKAFTTAALAEEFEKANKAQTKRQRAKNLRASAVLPIAFATSSKAKRKAVPAQRVASSRSVAAKKCTRSQRKIAAQRKP